MCFRQFPNPTPERADLDRERGELATDGDNEHAELAAIYVTRGTVSGSSLLFLALLGSLAARAGGSPVWRSVAHVTFWGALAVS